MFRIGIVGSDNSHAEVFSKLLNVGLDPADPLSKFMTPEGGTPPTADGGNVFLFPDYRVTAIFGTDPARTKEVAELGKIPTIVEKPSDMFPLVDGVMVVWRHGGLHFRYALPFIKQGMPVWIDKPFTIDIYEAMEIFAEAKKSGTVLAGGSTVKYLPKIQQLKARVAEAGDDFKGGSMTYAVSMQNEYGGINFYGQHLVECALEVFGYDVKSVYATTDGANTTAVLNYPTRSCVLHFVSDNYKYRVLLHIGKESEYCEFEIPGTYTNGFREFDRAIKAHKTLIDPEKFLTAIKVMAAVERSLAGGAPETLKP